ncbi:MAG: Gfo/Idh/MocA family oxidoreductase [Gammaproteobacteria bacterium]|nr:Gfo/Idh/MocA family oxidoreductase [Gammaproteobacteria bacterium]
MKIACQNKQFDVLDDHLYKNSVRIKVMVICNIEKNSNQFMEREKSLRKIFYYLNEVGIKSTFQKIISRTREKIRNEKYFSVGIGRIIQSATEQFPVEKYTYFIATNHPACPERVVVHENFVFSCETIQRVWISESSISVILKNNLKLEWENLMGWSPYAGIPAPVIPSASKEKIIEFFKRSEVEEKNKVNFKLNNVISEIKVAKKTGISNQKNAALFGYGNYAKTMLLPNLNQKIKVTYIHEIDSTQILPIKNNINYDTSPNPRAHLKHDVYFVAGYHHTHTEIAIAGLVSGTDVVVEKPLMTTKHDLDKLIIAMKNSPSNFYACFQRRYHRFNDYFFRDFNLKLGDPISYYAIIYEETLPKLHWYRWPNSRTAIISNGCHWIDHFLHLNNFSPVFSSSALQSRQGEIIILVELENGAALSLTLSHLGSARIGMQEYIELRCGQNTAKITNGKHYQSESNARVVRRTTVHKYESYRKMYHSISNHIVDKNAPPCHDGWEKVYAASSLILSLDEMLYH